MKKFLTAVLVLGIAIQMISCSALDIIADSTVKSYNEGNASSYDGGASDGSSSERSSEGKNRNERSQGNSIPPQMIPMMFPAFYYAYFFWAGAYTSESLKPGEWAKYEFINHEKDADSEKGYLTKAYLRKESKTVSWYLLKFGSQKNWMSFTFKVENNSNVTAILFKTNDSAEQEISINQNNPVVLQNPQNAAINYKTLPKERVQTAAGKFNAFKWSVSAYNAKNQEGGKVSIYISPAVPGYLVKYEINEINKDYQGLASMSLVAFGKNAPKEIKD